MSEKKHPAEKLLGIILNDGWFVNERIVTNSSTSGQYSTCYLVTKGNRKGFLKAFDYRDLKKPGGQDIFSLLNDKYLREKNIIKKCKESKLRNIVEYITSSDYFFIEEDINEKVEYFITEYSIDGNVQNCIKNDELIDLSNKFRVLADIIDGISELHKNKIWHLDVKPSNLLYFVEKRITKITDFGSARQFLEQNDIKKKKEFDSIFTTRLYAPPEVLYFTQWTDNWDLSRRKIDLYLIGNVIVKMFTNFSFTALLRKEITEIDDWNNSNNNGRFIDVLPNLMAASSNVYLLIKSEISRINKTFNSPLELKEIDQIILMIKQLCNPDPKLRGDPKELSRKLTEDDGLSRYRDRFIRLSKLAEFKSKSIYKTPKQS